jgi:hypothetical protein
MKYKDEIGLEQEVWLLDSGDNIVEPAIYSFPHDDFGFLIELRSLPHEAPKLVLADLQNLMDGFSNLACLFGLKLELKESMPIDRSLIYELRIKYNYFNLKDLTENINSGTIKTHATGISDNAELLTAGLHVHFSRKLDDKRVQLPIHNIVDAMDLKFKNEIAKAKRISGEYEIKPYGFEYRSLPVSVDLSKVLDFAFSLF